MTRPHQGQTQLPLTTDDVVEITRIGKSADEKRFDRALVSRRKLQRIQPDPAPTTGPACGRCQFCAPPSGKATHGTCRIRQILMKRIPMGQTGGREIPPGTVIERHQKTGAWMESPKKAFPFTALGEWEAFRCGPAWSCGSYVEQIETGRAA